MGFRALRTFSLLMFIHLIILASSYPTKNILPSEFVQNCKLEDKAINESKTEGGGAHGGAGHGGQTHGGGGGAVIPVYAAGAANKNHQPANHRGAANCNLNKIEKSSMLMMIFVYSLILFLLT